jgi:hypothetical protein
MRVEFGYFKLMHGESKRFEYTLTEEGYIKELDPKPSEAGVRCLGYLSVPPKCSAYGDLRVNWNVAEDQFISRDMLPFTVRLELGFRAWRGEYWGNRAGEEAPEIGLWMSPNFEFTPTPPEQPAPTPPKQPTPPSTMWLITATCILTRITTFILAQ